MRDRGIGIWRLGHGHREPPFWVSAAGDTPVIRLDREVDSLGWRRQARSSALVTRGLRRPRITPARAWRDARNPLAVNQRVAPVNQWVDQN